MEKDKMTDERLNKLWAELMGIPVEKLEDGDLYYEGDREDEDGTTYRLMYLCDPVNDMSQCWMLVEKMEAEGYDWSMSGGLTTLYDFYLHIGVDTHYEGTATRPQRAIIMACAKAKGLVE
jgi:hypothetical protein